ALGLPRVEQAHAAAHLRHGLAGEHPRLRRARAQRRAHAARLRLKRLRLLADGSERGYHIVRQHAFAVEAAPARSATIVRYPRLGLGAREALVDGEGVADVGVAGDFTSGTGVIGCCRMEIL